MTLFLNQNYSNGSYNGSYYNSDTMKKTQSNGVYYSEVAYSHVGPKDMGVQGKKSWFIIIIVILMTLFAVANLLVSIHNMTFFQLT